MRQGYVVLVVCGSVPRTVSCTLPTQWAENVAFAAPGAGLTVAYGKDGLRNVDGTSFASPFVAAAYAMSTGESTEVTRLLADGAQDLGALGRDPVYGWGLLQYSAVPGC